MKFLFILFLCRIIFSAINPSTIISLKESENDIEDTYGQKRLFQQTNFKTQNLLNLIEEFTHQTTEKKDIFEKKMEKLN